MVYLNDGGQIQSEFCYIVRHPGASVAHIVRVHKPLMFNSDQCLSSDFGQARLL
jgi:hypothetical protein